MGKRRTRKLKTKMVSILFIRPSSSSYCWQFINSQFSSKPNPPSVTELQLFSYYTNLFVFFILFPTFPFAQVPLLLLLLLWHVAAS